MFRPISDQLTQDVIELTSAESTRNLRLAAIGGRNRQFRTLPGIKDGIKDGTDLMRAVTEHRFMEAIPLRQFLKRSSQVGDDGRHPSPSKRMDSQWNEIRATADLMAT